MGALIKLLVVAATMYALRTAKEEESEQQCGAAHMITMQVLMVGGVALITTALGFALAGLCVLLAESHGVAGALFLTGVAALVLGAVSLIIVKVFS